MTLFDIRETEDIMANTSSAKKAVRKMALGAPPSRED